MKTFALTFLSVSCHTLAFALPCILRCLHLFHLCMKNQRVKKAELEFVMIRCMWRSCPQPKWHVAKRFHTHVVDRLKDKSLEQGIMQAHYRTSLHMTHCGECRCILERKKSEGGWLFENNCTSPQEQVQECRGSNLLMNNMIFSCRNVRQWVRKFRNMGHKSDVMCSE